jgi:ABC-type sugar transport system substrate-binding protein
MRNLTLLFVVALALVAPSCNRETPRAGDKKTVALVLKTLNHPFFVDMRRGAQEAADRLGVTLQVQAAEREIDVDKQMQIVENLLQTGIDVLAITPSGSREIVSALVKATPRTCRS